MPQPHDGRVPGWGHRQYTRGCRPIGGKSVCQIGAGALPALVLVIFAGVFALLGLACDHDRRGYALAYADRFIELAAVLVGRPRGPSGGVTSAGPRQAPS